MKSIRFASLIIMTGFIMVACNKDASQLGDATVNSSSQLAMSDEATQVQGKNNGSSGGPCNPNAYEIVLESRTQSGSNWEWVWSVRNPNPGNGNNGTAQDLSHWGMQLGSCVNWSSIVSAAYSSNGTSWSSFTPSYQADPSQNCYTQPVLKFDFGTNGAAKSYYKIVFNQAYEPETAAAYYKSGSRTGCCVTSFTGVGCGGPVEIEIIE